MASYLSKSQKLFKCYSITYKITQHNVTCRTVASPTNWQRMASTASGSGRELRISIPIGEIAALEWGPSDGIPVLALHGWQDNALTFQPLIPHLPKNLRVVAIDFPGHGLSPHYGAGAMYSHFSYLNNVFQIAKTLGWDKFNIIAHSMGAMIGIQFAAYYPQRLERLVTLDTIYPQVQATLAVGATGLPTIMKMYTDLEIKKNAPPTEITWDAAVKSFSKDRAVSQENILTLIQRSVRPAPTPGKWVFTRDPRIRILNVPKVEFTEPTTVMQMLEGYQGVWLAIMSKGDEIAPKKLEREKQMKEKYGKTMKLFQVERLNGSHFIHLDNPETVGKLIGNIFQNTNSKL